MAALHRPAISAPRAFGRPISRRTVVVAVAVVAVLAAMLQVNQFSRATSTSYTIDALARERASKQAQNQELAAEVAQLSSLARVEQDARGRLGLVPAKRTIYLEVHAAPPAGGDAAPVLVDPAPAPAKHHAPLWKRALKLIPFL